jgi:hypothetical protein
LAGDRSWRSKRRQLGGRVTVFGHHPKNLIRQNILNLPFYGENFTANNITSIVAGNNISYNIDGSGQSPAIELAGPGVLDVIAGGNISFPPQPNKGTTETGIRTLGNSVDAAANPDPSRGVPVNGETKAFLADFGNSYLPIGGASVNVLFGVRPGMDITDFAAAYVNPATAITTAYLGDLTGFVTQYEQNNGTPLSGSPTATQAWTIFKTLPAAQQQLLVEQVFLDILNTTGLDSQDPSSATYHQYQTGYAAIDTLFPPSFGYTANGLGTVNGAGQLVTTGSFDMRSSTVQTQQGGNISILGPGGRVLVGSAVAAPAANPASQGILTLEKGSIDIFADQSVLVAQSRIMTEQGGNILMWSSNGNLDAGEGAKTSVSSPPPLYDCDSAGFHCSADIKGQVSGAGIATLQSLPGMPRGDANLIAPRGIVNFGAAGLRVSGNLNVAALQVLNTFNVQVQGAVTGLPTYTGPSTSALVTASNVAGSTQAVLAAPAQDKKEQPSIIIVEVIGYGGGDNSDDNRKRDDRQKTDGRQGLYDMHSRFQLVGAGEVTDAEAKQLANERRVETGR